MQWTNAATPPPAKEGWNHSAQVLVHYPATENGKVETYGIAYYHYEPPFKAGPEYVDFANYGRQPDRWTSIID